MIESEYILIYILSTISEYICGTELRAPKFRPRLLEFHLFDLQVPEPWTYPCRTKGPQTEEQVVPVASHGGGNRGPVLL